ncbi:MAG: type II toxin-antitoxin system prevent-host-death family antitoxin [Deltaproteobacteria bacterium]|nr:type II toxin-antitoxin system prevent-host-death family antitoxin [Deltaproteobacteria bacterium]
MKVCAKDLRTHTRRLLEAVERGEEVIVTYRGKPRAKLVALEPRDFPEGEVQELFGIWSDYEAVEDVERYLGELRKGRY